MTNNIPKIDIKPVLRLLLQAAAIHENSYDFEVSRYVISIEEAMEQVCDGDKLLAGTLAHFWYWTNDIQSYAAHYGMRLYRNLNVGVETVPAPLEFREDVPAAPDEEHWWDFNESKWVAPDPENQDIAKA